MLTCVVWEPQTVWLPRRSGMSEAVLQYIEARAFGCCAWSDEGGTPTDATGLMVVVLLLAVTSAVSYLAGMRRGAAKASGEGEPGERGRQEEGSALLGKAAGHQR